MKFWRTDITLCRWCGRPDDWGESLSKVLLEIEEAQERAGDSVGTDDEQYARGYVDGMTIIAHLFGLSEGPLS